LRNPPTPPRTPDRIHHPWKYKDPFGPQDPRSSLNQKRKFPPMKRTKPIVLAPPVQPTRTIGCPDPDPVAMTLSEKHLGLTYFDFSGCVQKQVK
jgi:hypothetical protein